MASSLRRRLLRRRQQLRRVPARSPPPFSPPPARSPRRYRETEHGSLRHVSDADTVRCHFPSHRPHSCFFGSLRHSPVYTVCFDLLLDQGHHSSPHLCRNTENAAHTGAKSLALEKLSSKLGGKDIYEVIVSHGSRNMIKDLNEGLNKNGFMRVGEKCVSRAPADSPCLHLNVNMDVGATDVWPVPRIFTERRAVTLEF
ncbi:hypothetical protein MJG53_012594 [Ovis ammon polii x Ovis aries]|uniref:Uncharacterized protein n=1 Tax=Ovis ammon polii x Ovis aries TaxID=2918886 RepID=A0ACB9UKY4_9CETA|nr:hypothetical protein MJG53_012594 [Ovis ammon polii x Ovis aries]